MLREFKPLTVLCRITSDSYCQGLRDIATLQIARMDDRITGPTRLKLEEGLKRLLSEIYTDPTTRLEIVSKPSSDSSVT